MRKENRELLEKVLKDRLELVYQASANDEDVEETAAFKEAMQIADLLTEMEKNEEAKHSRISCDKAKAKDSKINFWLRVGEIGVTVIAVPLIDYLSKKRFAHMICEFEKDYTFTTSAGRGLSSLFRFK